MPVVAAEDTRRTRGLLTHLGANPTILSFHAHSDEHRLETLLEILARRPRCGPGVATPARRWSAIPVPIS